MPLVRYTRDRQGEDYVLRSRYGPVGRDTARRTTLVTADAIRRAPVGKGRPADQWNAARVPGRLKRSIRSEITHLGGEIVGRIVAEDPKALLVHERTPAHLIFPRRKRVLRWPGAGGSIFATRVQHPGTKGQPFFRDALKAGRG